MPLTIHDVVGESSYQPAVGGLGETGGGASPEDLGQLQQRPSGHHRSGEELLRRKKGEEEGEEWRGSPVRRKAARCQLELHQLCG